MHLKTCDTCAYNLRCLVLTERQNTTGIDVFGLALPVGLSGLLKVAGVPVGSETPAPLHMGASGTADAPYGL